jgi:hypothetical protein
VAVFFLLQTPVERPEEEEALQAGYPLVAESTQAAPAPLPLPAGAEAEAPRLELRAVEKPQLLPSGSLKLHRAPSRNTTAAVADILAVSVALRFGLPFVPYPGYCGDPGTPLSASLLISNEIL